MSASEPGIVHPVGNVIAVFSVKLDSAHGPVPVSDGGDEICPCTVKRPPTPLQMKFRGAVLGPVTVMEPVDTAK